MSRGNKYAYSSSLLTASKLRKKSDRSKRIKIRMRPIYNFKTILGRARI